MIELVEIRVAQRECVGLLVVVVGLHVVVVLLVVGNETRMVGVGWKAALVGQQDGKLEWIG